jgi:hypothetical protein
VVVGGQHYQIRIGDGCSPGVLMAIWLLENISSNRQVHFRRETFANLFQVGLCTHGTTGRQSYVKR